jgi:hypothetical protein
LSIVQKFWLNLVAPGVFPPRSLLVLVLVRRQWRDPLHSETSPTRPVSHYY